MNATLLTNEIRPVLPDPTPAVAEVAPRVVAATATSSPGANPRRPRRLAVVLVIATLTAIGTAAWLWWPASSFESTDSAFVDGHRVALAAHASGRVSELFVEDNEHVVAGQVVLRIDPADYQVKLDQAEAAQAQAEGALAHARAQLPVTEAIARQAGAQVQIADATARKYADDLRRYRQLSADAVSRITLDAAATQNEVSGAQVEAARQGALAAQAQVALARTAVTTAEANLHATDALVAQARLNLTYCELRAPIAGFITRKNVERGNFIQVGQPVLNLVPEDLFVTANFKETQLTHLVPGQPVTLTVDAYPGITFTGRVDSRMAGTGSAFALLPPENATGNFVKVVQRVPVKIVFDRPALDRLPPLALGMSVIATVDVSQTPTHVLSTVVANP